MLVRSVRASHASSFQDNYVETKVSQAYNLVKKLATPLQGAAYLNSKLQSTGGTPHA